MDYDPADAPACVRADERMIRACSRVLAVWDGSPSTARDATAHLVAYARGLGRSVDVLWPVGAERRTP
ncbi:nucleoside 2-deoxyribosyltransferase [Streptomyces sp. NK15101]|uniref:nucleoside 2-deoxyribosyltransferase n=1 Tax=Streptomyces sp. NK15101 TaxID=2873261 RepID=UPI001CED2D13|nr:nucleoside 2-deoxyribosyltransferase [Streptomyces sp. NK15101]